jgi:hypothetical protein
MRRTCSIAFLSLFLTAASLAAQTANTLDAVDVPDRPMATLADAAWLEGDWRGRGLGADVQDIWTPAMGGAMLGASRVVRDGEVSFYEILVLAEQKETLQLRLKHFHADLKGWEERDEVRAFPLLRVTDTELWFDGITFRRVSENDLQVWVAIAGEHRQIREEEFRFRRADAQ